MAQEKKSAEIVQLVVAELSHEEYGIPITQVQEIIKIPEVTRIPNMPEFIEGVINLRGKVHVDCFIAGFVCLTFC